MTIEEVCAREEIRYTLSVYTSAGDRGAMDELASAFMPDGVLELFGQTFTGRAAIVERLSAVVDSDAASPPRVALGFMRHNLTSCRIELRGPAEADAWTYFLVTPRSASTTPGSTSTGSAPRANAG